MNAGYLRISKDDDGSNYSSIENQRLILTQFACKHQITIDQWYEDDGFSGYSFERPAFQEMLKNPQIDCILLKDLSRLGRHNARVLLLLDQLKEQGIRLLIADDQYESFSSTDDLIGIKTWFNERYIKDTSRKIKASLLAKQQSGTLRTKPPMGYCRINDEIQILPKEAQHIKHIFQLYLEGNGYRKIANILNRSGIPTPSMCQKKTNPALLWSDGMVRDILSNEFYAGTLLLHKRSRNTIHGKDLRVTRAEQYAFPNHHPAIITMDIFHRVQKLRASRVRTAFPSPIKLQIQREKQALKNLQAQYTQLEQDILHKIHVLEQKSP